MQLNQHVHMLGDDLKRRYGERIHKLTLHGAFTCARIRLAPWDVVVAPSAMWRRLPMSKPRCCPSGISCWRAPAGNRAKRYLAYFQAYTSTYAEVGFLRQMYEEALQAADIVGLCVGTRPDCVPDAVLDLLAGYQQQGFEIWLELGLQSANDATLKRINRGHDCRAYENAVIRARARQLKVCTHLIVGLPGEVAMDSLATLQQVVRTGTDGIKLHPLHVVEGAFWAKPGTRDASRCRPSKSMSRRRWR